TYSIDNIDKVIDMKRTNSIYKATIPQQPENTRVFCTVSVLGEPDLFEEYEFEYLVGETVDFSFFSLEIIGAIIIVIILIAFFLSKA
ncbi:MAG: hypothetical protein NWF10_06895, partial [Candidatus Bathyarchaeota archaeon]|nr:hypothetical protein [Candidatus Bathyarchaeota archaeon]